jgi:PilZ domain
MATPGPETAQEKRSSPRNEMKVPARVHTDGTGVSAEALNLSQSGIFLDCETKVSEGSAVDIVMILPKEITGDAAKWVCCHATVNRVEDQRSEGRYGVAATVDRIQAMPELTWPEVDRRITERRAGERRVVARGGQDRRRRDRRNPASK